LKDTHFINTFEFHSLASKACTSVDNKEEGNILILDFLKEVLQENIGSLK
jgi:hypothetical protein